MQGRAATPEAERERVEKIRAYRTGRQHSAETKRRMSETQIINGLLVRAQPAPVDVEELLARA
jgi:hypothetical protein